LDVVLWGERATSFPAEQLHKDGQNSPYIVIFVSTLVRGYAGMYISPWYITCYCSTILKPIVYCIR
jgi:hypothetical protein